MDLRIKEPESTLTHDATRPSEPEGTKHGDVDRLVQPREESFGGGQAFGISLPPGPPKGALLHVVMTFVGDGVVRMEAVEIDITIEGRDAPTVYGRLIDAISAHLEASGDERAEPFPHTPDEWLRFVSPDQAAKMDANAGEGDLYYFDALPSLDALAAAQGVQPIEDIDDLVTDFWPEDESVEDFIAAATEGRHEEDEPDS